MLKYFDSHVHFDGLGSPDDADAAVRRAVEAGVEGMMAVGGSEAGNADATALAERHPDLIVAAAGYDREQAGRSPAIESVEVLAAGGKIRAIGETGLDFHYRPETASAQKTLFAQMLELARENRLPVIVHSRNAEAETLELLRRHRDQWIGESRRIGVIHCFTGSAGFAQAAVDLGFSISFSGILSFSNAAELRVTAGGIPEENLLIETDTPYLAPEPYRGKRNEPAYVRRVAEVLAGVRGCPVERIAEVTTRNARRLFGVGGVEQSA